MNKRVWVDGELVDLAAGGECSIEPVEPGVWSVLVEGRSHDVCIEGNEAWLSGRSHAVLVEDPRELSAGPDAAGGGGRREIKSPMPGRVIRVLVSEGEEVAAGQCLVVVEAMKMQNEMPSPKTGRVVMLGVKAGDTVAGGQILAAVE
jgi:biotin carboxyl carrier protein